jgi:hypothetical protein
MLPPAPGTIRRRLRICCTAASTCSLAPAGPPIHPDELTSPQWSATSLRIASLPSIRTFAAMAGAPPGWSSIRDISARSPCDRARKRAAPAAANTATATSSHGRRKIAGAIPEPALVWCTGVVTGNCLRIRLQIRAKAANGSEGWDSAAHVPVRRCVRPPYSFGPIPKDFILRYRLLRSSPSSSAARVTLPRVSSSFL